jgi:hypothetical protein
MSRRLSSVSSFSHVPLSWALVPSCRNALKPQPRRPIRPMSLQCSPLGSPPGSPLRNQQSCQLGSRQRSPPGSRRRSQPDSRQRCLLSCQPPHPRTARRRCQPTHQHTARLNSPPRCHLRPRNHLMRPRIPLQRCQLRLRLARRPSIQPPLRPAPRRIILLAPQLAIRLVCPRGTLRDRRPVCRQGFRQDRQPVCQQDFQAVHPLASHLVPRAVARLALRLPLLQPSM